jgi:hypothetical protein
MNKKVIKEYVQEFNFDNMELSAEKSERAELKRLQEKYK